MTMNIETIGGPVETTEEYDEAAERLEELEAREAELEAELAELEAREEELVEKSGQLRAEAQDASALREKILEVRAEQDQVESGIAKLGPRIQEAERAVSEAEATCYQREAERLQEKGCETLEELLEVAHEGVRLFREWHGKPGELGDKDRFERCARRAEDQAVLPMPKHDVASVRNELTAVLAAFEKLSGDKKNWDHLRDLEEENEAAE